MQTNLHFQINCKGQLVDLTTPLVMGILNTTPDSFYSPSRVSSQNAVITKVTKMLEDGASIIDVGAISTRPGAADISLEEELLRLEPVLAILQKEFPTAILSIDTFRAEVAKTAVEKYGAAIINDISAGEADEQMPQTIAKLGVPYIIMHKQGTPQSMQNSPQYKNVVYDILKYLAQKTQQFKQLGIKDIIIDPGIGFGKTIEHNFEIIRKLEEFAILEYPLLIGVSRKSMIYKTLDTTPENAINGTSVLHTIALQKNAKILRVHDVKEASECIKLVKTLNLI